MPEPTSYGVAGSAAAYKAIGAAGAAAGGATLAAVFVLLMTPLRLAGMGDGELVVQFH